MTKKKSSVPAPREKEKGKNPFVLAAVVSDLVQIEDVRILESRVRQSPVRQGARRQLRASNKVEVDFSIDTDRDEIVVLPRFTFRAIDGEAGAGEPAVTIDCLFALTYAAARVSELPNANLKAFAQINGVFNAWPYWREFVQNTAARMGLPNLIIPVFRFREPSSPRRKTSPKGER